jgi:acetyl-CoA acyltransferase
MSLRTAYIVEALRSPIGRHRGALSSVRADDLAAHMITSLLARAPGLAPRVDHANQAGEDNRNVARMAALLAGLPLGARRHREPALRLGMDAVGDAARAIGRRLRPDDRGRRREHDPRAVRHAQGRPPSRAPRREVYDTTLGWRFVNPRMAERFP